MEDAPAATRRVRFRWSCQILYGRYTDFMDLQRRKEEVAGTKGWHRARYWVATAGSVNDFFLEREYESLAELANELQAREEDHEFMRLMRASYPLVVQGSIRVELFEELPMR